MRLLYQQHRLYPFLFSQSESSALLLPPKSKALTFATIMWPFQTLLSASVPSHGGTMLSRKSSLALFVVFLLVVTAAMGQTDRGSISGHVTDPNGGGVANAKITATNLNTAETREVKTSDDGNYTIPELKADPYKVTVEAAGFKTASAENFVVAVQVNRTLDFKLEIGEISSVVTVTNDEAPVLQTETPVRQTNVTERQVKELPLLVSSEFAGRTPLSFIYLDSNVTQGAPTQGGSSTDTTRFRISGGQALGTEILIDGASTRRTQNGTFFSEVAPGPNAFQEFTLSTSTYSAEFGNSSGGIVNFTQKSGGNDFHGELYDLIRNEKLDANTFRNNALNIPRARDNQNDFGFNVGGPITVPHFGEGGPMIHTLRNRAFFFVNYEGYRFTEGSNNIITVPTLKMRRGDFSELLTDPYILNFFGHGVQLYDPRQPAGTRVPIPGNRIALYLRAARIDS